MGFHATLVVMAAGMGSRFGGLKQVEPIGPRGESLVDFSIYDAVAAGFDKVVFVIKHSIDGVFRETVGRRTEERVAVEYVYQELDRLPEGFSVPAGREKPWGTGHAILCCEDAVREPFAVINADDFYGASGYGEIYRHLRDKNSYCMVGFRLGDTVTENGTVSRGVCSTENGLLRGITEHTKIDGRCRSTAPDGTVRQLSPDTVVSMNMWGFTPSIFPVLQGAFREFLAENGDSLKAEFFFNTVLDGLIHTGEQTVTVLPGSDKWYGVTYREDKEPVVAAIRALIDAGRYPGM